MHFFFNCLFSFVVSKKLAHILFLRNNGEINQFLGEKNDVIFATLNQIKVSRVPQICKSGICHLFAEGHLKIHLQCFKKGLNEQN